jgi:archaellum component FlaC
MACGLTPDEVNSRLLKVGGYANTNLVIWSKINEAIPTLSNGTRFYTYDNDKVKQAIEKNGFCLVEVDGTRIGASRHWCLYVGGGQMYDPWTGVQKSTSYYPALGYAVIDKISLPTLPSTPEDPRLTQCEADLAEQRKQVSNLQAQVNGLLVDIKAWETKYNECNTQRIEANTSADGFRKQLNDFIAQLAQKLGTRQETVEILASIDTLITYEDKAAELDRQMALQAKEYQSTIDSLEKEIDNLKSTTEASAAKIRQLENTIKELRYSTVTPIQTNSFLDIIKKLLGVK